MAPAAAKTFPWRAMTFAASSPTNPPRLAFDGDRDNRSFGVDSDSEREVQSPTYWHPWHYTSGAITFTAPWDNSSPFDPSVSPFLPRRTSQHAMDHGNALKSNGTARASAQLVGAALAIALVAAFSTASSGKISAAEKPTPTSAGAAGERFAPARAAREWNAIVLHHSASAGGNVETIHALHRQNRDSSGKHWLGIGYHFVVGNGKQMADGEIQPTFRWNEQLPGAHAGAREYNEQGIGICLIGNFDDAPPTERQWAATRELVQLLADRYAIRTERVLRHQDVQSTLCPGKLFPFEQLRDLVARAGGS